ncbi:MAG: GNAT family N-acetyltransferase [Chitinophagaceae bacterium]
MNQPSPIIRLAQPGDVETIISLCAEHAAYEQASYCPEGKKQKLHELLFSTAPRLFCFVADVNNNIIGYTTCSIEVSTWDAATYLHMDCLYIQASYRSMGIGRLLLQANKQLAIEKNCHQLQWQTPAFNTRAAQFYLREGAEARDKIRFSMKTENGY